MKTERQIASELLKRLLAGERGNLPSHLSSLLERSSSLADGDALYRSILPPELADIHLSREASDEIVATLCEEISRNPEAAFIFAVASSGADQSTRIVAKVLTNPPRPLTTTEYACALSLVNEYLPLCLQEDVAFLPRTELIRLAQVVAELEKIENGETPEEKSAVHSIRYFAPKLLKSLEQFGIDGGGGWAGGPVIN
jgi:hypothetical protein